MPERCPTCGGAVEVVTADEGTSSYRPVDRGALARERDEMARRTRLSTPDDQEPPE